MFEAGGACVGAHPFSKTQIREIRDHLSYLVRYHNMNMAIFAPINSIVTTTKGVQLQPRNQIANRHHPIQGKQQQLERSARAVPILATAAELRGKEGRRPIWVKAALEGVDGMTTENSGIVVERNPPESRLSELGVKGWSKLNANSWCISMVTGNSWVSPSTILTQVGMSSEQISLDIFRERDVLPAKGKSEGDTS
ncbi:hypothetical protein Dimus_010488 [Dionaea muscipula]